MANTTPGRDYYYPGPGDRIENFPAQQKALVEKLDTDVTEALMETVDVTRIPDLPASKTTSGTFAKARIPAVDASMLDPTLTNYLAAQATTAASTAVANAHKDTGERNIASLVTGLAGGTITLSRVGQDVILVFDGVKTTSSGTLTGMISLPVGFRPRPTYVYCATAQRSVASSPVRGFRLSKYGSLDFYEADTTHTYYAYVIFKTFDTFPTTLPGTPA